MCWLDLLPRHLLAVGCAAINTMAQVGAFLMLYAWGAAKDATGGFETGLVGLAACSALAIGVALATRSQAQSRPLEPRPA
jgi:hypothetical protein